MHSALTIDWLSTEVVNSFSCSTGMVLLRFTILAIMPPSAGGGSRDCWYAGWQQSRVQINQRQTAWKTSKQHAGTEAWTLLQPGMAPSCCTALPGGWRRCRGQRQRQQQQGWLPRQQRRRHRRAAVHSLTAMPRLRGVTSSSSRSVTWQGNTGSVLKSAAISAGGRQAAVPQGTGRLQQAACQLLSTQANTQTPAQSTQASTHPPAHPARQ